MCVTVKKNRCNEFKQIIRDNKYILHFLAEIKHLTSHKALIK